MELHWGDVEGGREVGKLGKGVREMIGMGYEHGVGVAV